MALAAMARDWADKPTHLVVGMLQSKDPARFLEPLASVISSVHGIPIPGDKSCHDAADIAAIAADLGIAPGRGADVADAVSHVLGGNHGPGRILLCGSLRLAGAVLGENG
jgi:dihydrofolate synthase/folylpolyglutamate synthase